MRKWSEKFDEAMIEEIRASTDVSVYADVLDVDGEEAARTTEQYLLRNEIGYRKLNNLYANAWGVVLMVASVVILAEMPFSSRGFIPILIFAYLALSWSGAFLMIR